VKNRPRNARVVILTAVLFVGAAVLLLREQRAAFLRPGLHLNGYVSTADGVISIIDLVKLGVVARVSVGPGISGMREHPTRAEVWGTSSLGGYVWVLDSRSNHVSARIPVGPLPYALDFSADGNRIYTAVSGNNTLVAIDCASRSVIGRAQTGKTVLVVNRRDATLGVHDSATLALRGTIPVVPQPEDVMVLADGSTAFVLSRTEPRLSVVDLRRGVLLTNLQLAGKPSQMLLKPDGGELYVISPDAHGLQAINTWTHEVGDYVLLGSAPTHGVLMPDASRLFVSDTAAGRIAPVDIDNRRVSRPIPAGQNPGVLRLDLAESEENPSLLLVVNEGSGDLAVIRVRPDRQNLVTLVPIGDRPHELAIKLF
jgi:DNA-binding beta-propeller fold protein YncE